ncbi:MAG: exodeoxyribonuclease VII large subunit [Proteobacteria bacterium]|nr:exodeoxyribonuclease VII large subunit [Pseudomonadota bacterium]MDE3208680.1 exodeoxyribonuclease VII large subunit [Pseudomonadota bacterium]
MENLNTQPNPNRVNNLQKPGSVTLSSFLSDISSLIQQTTKPEWIRVEISRIQERRHIYLELVEHNIEGQEIAKCSARIWQGRKQLILDKFHMGAGSTLEAGIQILIRVEASFHPQYGFALTILDIDPTYTLGGMELKLAEIRARLQQENLYWNNQALPNPIDFTRVAVLSPEGAAGLGDFSILASKLETAKLCTFDYFTAVFQGINAPQFILACLNEIDSRQNMALDGGYDALVIIRGGGAATDLAWLNDYVLAASICTLNLPVFTGIGHQQDNTILDEVAHTRFDTPSKVIGYISNQIRESALLARHNWETINLLSRQSLTETEQRLQTACDWLSSKMRNQVHLASISIQADLSIINSKVRDNLHLAKTTLATSSSTLRMGAENQVYMAKNSYTTSYRTVLSLSQEKTNSLYHELYVYKQTIGNLSRHSITIIQSHIQAFLNTIEQQTYNNIDVIRHQIQNYIEIILGLGPQETLKRGYVLAWKDNTVVTRASEALKHGALTLEFSDGRVHALHIMEK